MGETPGSPTVSMKLQSIAQQARGYPAMVFNNVFHLIAREFWREAYHQTQKSSAPGQGWRNTQADWQVAARGCAGGRKADAPRQGYAAMAVIGACGPDIVA